MSKQETFVIVGAGQSGAKAAATLREAGFDGRVVLVGAERHRPYERPPLSKEYLRGEVAGSEVRVHDDAFYDVNDIELRTSTSVASIEPARREVGLSGGERLGYDRLLLATGAEPRRVSLPGANLEGVLYLRDLDDADAIRERLERGGKVAVVGGGWIGAEVAASARQKGLAVTVIEQADAPLERVLGRVVGDFFASLHRDHGVEVLTGVGVAAFEGEREVEGVRLSDGRTIACDLAVVGVGVLPRTELAERAGLAVENGVRVDERLEASTPGIFAAGDVANADHPVYGHLRVEHWATALNQGVTAARNMLGDGRTYDRVPYFFSDQYDLGLEYAGHARGSDEVVFRGDPRAREFIAFWLRDGRVAAGMNVNVWNVTEAIQGLVRAQVRIDVGELVDPSVPLEEVGRADRRVGV